MAYERRDACPSRRTVPGARGCPGQVVAAEEHVDVAETPVSGLLISCAAPESMRLAPPASRFLQPLQPIEVLDGESMSRVRLHRVTP